MHELPADLTAMPFAVGEAAAWGVTPGMLRRRQLIAPFHGVRMLAPRTDDESAGGRLAGDAPPVTAGRHLQPTEQRVLAYLPRLRDGQHFSHLTAARLWGMRLPGRLDSDVELDVTAIAPARAPRTRAVRGHAMRADAQGDRRPVMLAGIPLTPPVATWCALGEVLQPDELIVAADGLVCRRGPLATLDELRRGVVDVAGRRGAARLAPALRQVRPGTDSPRETRLRLLLVRAGLPEPLVNPVVSARGARIRYGDLVYPQWRVIVEYDGMHHAADRATYLADIDRAEELRDWRTVHVVAEHLADPARIVSRVSAALSAAGWTPTRSRNRRATA